jgi:CYTH domain-containing protein
LAALRQGELAQPGPVIVRVCSVGCRGFVSVTCDRTGVASLEMSYEIPVSDAEWMLDTLCPRR